jgi:hypothetical protein
MRKVNRNKLFKTDYLKRSVNAFFRFFIYPSVPKWFGMSLFFIFCLFLFTQCQEPVVGCLDARAVNFDVTAAKPCEDNCCQYPNLRLQLEYAYDTFSFKYLTNYKFGTDSIKIIGSQFYMSNCQLIKADATKATVLDSIAIFSEKDTIKVPNFYALLGRSNGFDATLGKFNEVGAFTKFSFTLGLDEKAAATVPTKMPVSSPLSIKADSMYISSEKKYIYNKLSIVRISKPTDTLRFTIKTPQNLTLTTTKTWFIQGGFDAIVPIKVDYKKWFEGVNFNDPVNSIQDKIVNNTAQAFLLNIK